MVEMAQVAEFMHRDVFNKIRVHADQPPAEPNHAIFFTAAPASCSAADFDTRRHHADNWSELRHQPGHILQSKRAVCLDTGLHPLIGIC